MVVWLKMQDINENLLFFCLLLVSHFDSIFDRSQVRCIPECASLCSARTKIDIFRTPSIVSKTEHDSENNQNTHILKNHELDQDYWLLRLFCTLILLSQP